MTDFPILQRTRADLARQLADMHRNDPRRAATARALVDATCRLMRRQVEAGTRPARPAMPTEDLFALLARRTGHTQTHTEIRP